MPYRCYLLGQPNEICGHNQNCFYKRVFVFLCVKDDWNLNVAGLKKQNTCVRCCFIFRKTASEMWETDRVIYCDDSENKQQPFECQGLFSPTSEECESSQAEYQVNVSDLC